MAEYVIVIRSSPTYQQHVNNLIHSIGVHENFCQGIILEYWKTKLMIFKKFSFSSRKLNAQSSFGTHNMLTV